MHPEDDAEQYKWCETQDGTLTVHQVLPVQQVFINLGSYGEHSPRLPHHIMGAIHLIIGVSLLVTLFASNNAAAIATNEVEPETAPAQNPKLVTAARWKPRRKVGESCDPTWLCQQHKHIRCEHGVCTIYHSHNKKCGTRGYKCKNWLMCMNGKCRRRRDWWRSRWPVMFVFRSR